MGAFIQVLTLTTTGIVLFWFGYTLFFGSMSPLYNSSFFPFKKKKITGEYGDPQVCPLCSIKLNRGELVKTMAFPSISGGRDRLMFIRGCFTCLYENFPRRCPVCGTSLTTDDFLISRMFERVNARNHVHVMGCNRCKNMGSLVR